MTPRVKSALLLLATLGIGMILGALLNARLAEQRMERLASLRSSRGFVRYMERAIEPATEEQREAVQAILRDAAERMFDHMNRTREEMRDLVDSTRAELAEVLTEEQMQRLEERLELRRREHPGRRDFRERRERPGRRGPPPPP